MRMLVRPALLLALLGTLSCNSSSSPAPSTPSTPTPGGQTNIASVVVPSTGGYSANGSSFQPGSVTISVGGTVTWTNQDSVEHAPAADDGSWQGDLPVGGSFSMTFNKAGSYPYHCTIHPMMKGTITVQ